MRRSIVQVQPIKKACITAELGADGSLDCFKAPCYCHSSRHSPSVLPPLPLSPPLLSFRMHRPPDHVMAFLLAELGTDGSLDGQSRLIVKGRFAPKNFEGILRRYISECICDLFVMYQ